MDMAGLLAAARKAGFRDEGALRRLARSAAVLRFGRKAGDGSSRGSKIGGLPTLLRPGDWPRHGKRRLAFLAQFDLADLPPAIAADLPPAGMLSFFYVADYETWGFRPGDAGKFAVVYLPDPAAAAPAPGWPADLPEEARFREFPAGFRETTTLPPAESLLVEELGLDGAAADAYGDLLEAVSSGGDDAGRSLLLGHPDQVQGDMAEECSLVTAGIDCGGADYPEDPRYPALRAKSREWRLLLQLHSLEEAGMCWGDLGNLYFWIRDADLRAREFGAAWMILQCT